MNTESENHKISMENRNHLLISGVNEVISFDDTEVDLKTVCGELNIDGKNIKISVLDTDSGKVEILGEIDSLYYSQSENSDKKRVFGKLFNK